MGCLGRRWCAASEHCMCMHSGFLEKIKTTIFCGERTGGWLQRNPSQKTGLYRGQIGVSFLSFLLFVRFCFWGVGVWFLSIPKLLICLRMDCNTVLEISGTFKMLTKSRPSYPLFITERLQNI